MQYGIGIAFLLATSQAFSPAGKARMGVKLSMATIAPAATEAVLATVRCILQFVLPIGFY